jgi:hypothetical protein
MVAASRLTSLTPALVAAAVEVEVEVEAMVRYVPLLIVLAF